MFYLQPGFPNWIQGLVSNTVRKCFMSIFSQLRIYKCTAPTSRGTQRSVTSISAAPPPCDLVPQGPRRSARIALQAGNPTVAPSATPTPTSAIVTNGSDVKDTGKPPLPLPRVQPWAPSGSLAQLGTLRTASTGQWSVKLEEAEQEAFRLADDLLHVQRNHGRALLGGPQEARAASYSWDAVMESFHDDDSFW